jgi:hypothetical protein
MIWFFKIDIGYFCDILFFESSVSYRIQEVVSMYLYQMYSSYSNYLCLWKVLHVPTILIENNMNMVLRRQGLQILEKLQLTRHWSKFRISNSICKCEEKELSFRALPWCAEPNIAYNSRNVHGSAILKGVLHILQPNGPRRMKW